MRAAAVALVLALAGSGCATFAKKPPTPADDLTPAQLLATPAPPNERYFILVFGSQSRPKVPKYTHSWATVVKVTDLGPGVAPAIEQSTISWMPATLDIRPNNFRVEPGVNLDLHTSIREMLKHDERVAMWGPFEIWHGAYQRFMTQKAFIDSGAIGYQCIDSLGEAARTGNGSDCIHAITDMDPFYSRSRYPLSFFGIGASRHAVRQILSRGAVIDPDRTHDCLIPLLGLDQYPIERVEYRGPKKAFDPEAIASGRR
ncbi:Uncharacterized protein OS=Planctomyces brasiliensis (strain ATCC 49424 / DSM 5305 / JCM 21570 / NBRC 103401 / IFAM 1448) GN=Plabr_4392 PE=4 SV=1 [Gemmataceae bacterium]|nr:Uncharacterized protein OS=Planctomyces brasiliensis (strain ATCC 49424 / DSM 5305 / JCM 21570 / NBRC 103401 / IFAM 1448) GN=Plabr_4392 PE=4 SV=1 [Gemmataceae bacterium]VTU00605.1 Uncharacterized protein OS=Planctomyces brasiliensis (strain ATCC 49424 / DSM 5305 / JCM 21570 / NBRC 103401 / IFAM 1448) GN=Plabr_4392 PE=4 SV=1 [Gemmataceae bacterium]